MTILSKLLFPLRMLFNLPIHKYQLNILTLLVTAILLALDTSLCTILLPLTCALSSTLLIGLAASTLLKSNPLKVNSRHVAIIDIITTSAIAGTAAAILAIVLCATVVPISTALTFPIAAVAGLVTAAVSAKGSYEESMRYASTNVAVNTLLQHQLAPPQVGAPIIPIGRCAMLHGAHVATNPTQVEGLYVATNPTQVKGPCRCATLHVVPNPSQVEGPSVIVCSDSSQDVQIPLAI